MLTLNKVNTMNWINHRLLSSVILKAATLTTVRLTAFSLMALIQSGCATGSKDTILPQEGPTMKEVYKGHFSGSTEHQDGAGVDLQGMASSSSGKRAMDQDSEIDLSSYTRNSKNEIQQIFPRLHNKTLILYIFPHLSRVERHPVPGYSTAFSFYEKTEYALPGEIVEDSE